MDYIDRWNYSDWLNDVGSELYLAHGGLNTHDIYNFDFLTAWRDECTVEQAAQLAVESMVE